MDQDLEGMSTEQLTREVKRLREAIRAHRDSTLQELCWFHPELWAVLPEKDEPRPTVPAWPQFLEGCIKYRQSLDAQLPDAPGSEEDYRG